MPFNTDLKNKEIGFVVDTRLYDQESLKQAAAVWLKQCAVFVQEGPGNKIHMTLALKKSGPATREEMTRMANEFLNELLNQEYRQIVCRFNKKIAHLIVTQALFSASQPPLQDTAEALEPQVAADRAAEVEALLSRAREKTA